MKRIEDFITTEVNEKLDEKSNKLSDVIARLQEIEKEIGGDVQVIASTQDGADYDVQVQSIQVEDWTAPGDKQIKVVHIA